MTNVDLSKVLEELYAANPETTKDQAVIHLVGEQGCSLNKAMNAYATFAKETGRTKTVVSHKEKALGWMEGEYSADEWSVSTVRECVARFQVTYGVTEATARGYTQAYSKKLGVSHPQEDPREAIFQWFKDHNGTADKDEFIEFATSIGRSRSNANEYWKGYELHLYLVG